MLKHPKIVATQEFTGQTSAISSTTIYTPTDDSTLVVSVFVANNDDNAPGSLGVLTLAYTNELGANITDNPDSAGNDPGGTGYSVQLNKTYRVQGGTPISISTRLEGPGPITYDVFIVITELEVTS